MGKRRKNACLWGRKVKCGNAGCVNGSAGATSSLKGKRLTQEYLMGYGGCHCCCNCHQGLKDPQADTDDEVMERRREYLLRGQNIRVCPILDVDGSLYFDPNGYLTKQMFEEAKDEEMLTIHDQLERYRRLLGLCGSEPGRKKGYKA